MNSSGELSGVLLLILVGFLPSDLWRMLGVVIGHGLDEKSQLIAWVRSVAIAILAGVIARLAVYSPGALAEVPMAVRLCAMAVGFFAFMVARRSVFAGVALGELALVGGGFFTTP